MWRAPPPLQQLRQRRRAGQQCRAAGADPAEPELTSEEASELEEAFKKMFNQGMGAEEPQVPDDGVGGWKSVAVSV